MTPQAGRIHLVHAAFITNRSLVTETISTMSTSTPSAVIGAVDTGNTGSFESTSGTKNFMINAYATTFEMPSDIKLNQFNDSNWSNWLGMLKAILILHKAEDIFTLSTTPTGMDKDDWDSVQRRTKAYIRLYVKPDVYSLIASDSEFPSFKDK